VILQYTGVLQYILQVHQLTHTHQEPVVRTLNKNRQSIMLRDTGHERLTSSKCCAL